MAAQENTSHLLEAVEESQNKISDNSQPWIYNHD